MLILRWKNAEDHFPQGILQSPRIISSVALVRIFPGDW